MFNHRAHNVWNNKHLREENRNREGRREERDSQEDRVRGSKKAQTSQTTVTGPPGNPGLKSLYFGGFPGGSVVKNLPASAGDMGSIPDLGRPHMWQNN